VDLSNADSVPEQDLLLAESTEPANTHQIFDQDSIAFQLLNK
jgi:hypothetical protein